LTEAIKAAEMLAKEKLPIDVINGRFAAPVDKKIISLLKKGKGIITVEDHSVACGFGSAVLELAAANKCPLNAVRLLGAPRTFIGHNSRDTQLLQIGINADTIVKTAKEMIKERTGKKE
jgi:1-deoxy-D-xylulose-5-phosphate synthase